MDKSSFAEVVLKDSSSPSILTYPASKVALDKPCVKKFSVWVRKEKEVVNLQLDSVLVVTKMKVHYSWMKIKSVLEDYFFRFLCQLIHLWMTRL